MSNIGQLTAQLILDSTQFSTSRPISENKALSGSIDSIIGQLERQKRAMSQASIAPLAGSSLTLSGQGTQQNILNSAAKGASEGQINSALQINQEVDALKQKAIAEREARQAAIEAQDVANQRAASGASLLRTLQDEIATYGKSAAQMQIYQAEQAGVKQVTLEAAQALQAQIKALRDDTIAQENANTAKRKAQEAGQSLVAGLKTELSIYGMTASEIKHYQASVAGASQEDIKAARAIQTKLDIQAGFDRSIQHQINQQRLATSATQTQSKSQLVLTETTRGLEDAVAGYTNNGIKGMIGATSNNINQIGSLLGGNAGLMLSFGSIAALIGASVIPKLYEMATSTKAAEEANEKLEVSSKKLHDSEMRRLDERRSRINARNDRNRENAEIRGEVVRPHALGNAPAQSTGEDLRAEEEKNKREIVMADRQREAARERMENLKSRRETLEARQRDGAGFLGESEEIQERRREKIFDIQDQEAESIATKKRAAIDRREAQERLKLTENARLKQELNERIREQNRQQAALAQADQEAAQAQSEEEDRRDSDRRSQKHGLAPLIIQYASALNDKFGEELAYKQKQQEAHDQVNRVFMAQSINEEQRDVLHGFVEQKPTYATDKLSGAQVAGSREAYSTIMAAMGRQGAEALQRQIAADNHEAVKLLEKISEKEPIEVIGLGNLPFS